ncbi:MAG: nucleotidyl transferase AbiEii/AbiGii toxin family protein [Euryarchaeota archaeon]|nr:nucleotidyl transferase AbiEii/AbiGii toxin family protein [Euryarchaeota archaeon]
MAGKDVELKAREQELYTVLQDWPDVQAIMVGGYAASAWSFPRFSHDLDFIISEADAPTLRDHFTSHKLSLTKERPDIEQNYGGAGERWEGGDRDVTVDLLVNSIQDRSFEIPMLLGELWKDRATRPVRGITESGLEMPVISKEALIALKCQPMRPRDIGDICAVAYTGYQADRLHELLAPIIEQRPDLFRERVDTLSKALGSTQEELQQALGPRIPGFKRIRDDMQVTVDGLLARLRRWGLAGSSA